MEHVERIHRLTKSNNVLILPYGSRVYGTSTYSSDYDYLVIGDGLSDDQEIRNGDLNFHTYTPEKYQDLLDNQKIVAVKAFMFSNPTNFSYRLDKQLLRKEIQCIPYEVEQ